jgi:hypothetical protein
MDSNAFTKVDKQMFLSLTELWELSLTNNKLNYLDKELFVSQKKLNKLLLRNNSLTSIGVTTMEPLKNLKEVDVSDNPLICDCNLKDSLLLIVSHYVAYNATCSAPDVLSGKSWELLQLLPCDKSTETPTMRSTRTTTTTATVTTTTANDATISGSATPTSEATTAVSMPLRLGESVNKTDNIATYSKPSVFLIPLCSILVLACYTIN